MEAVQITSLIAAGASLTAAAVSLVSTFVSAYAVLRPTPVQIDFQIVTISSLAHDQAVTCRLLFWKPTLGTIRVVSIRALGAWRLAHVISGRDAKVGTIPPLGYFRTIGRDHLFGEPEGDQNGLLWYDFGAKSLRPLPSPSTLRVRVLAEVSSSKTRRKRITAQVLVKS